MASNSAPDLSPLDGDRLTVLEDVGGYTFVADVLEDFMRNFEHALTELKICINDENAQRIAYLCHSIRASGANVGASSLAAACRRLEDMVTQSPIDWTGVKSLVDEILIQAPTLRAAVLLYDGTRSGNS